MFNKTALSTIAILTAGFIAGCTSDTAQTDKTGGISLALTQTVDGVTYCVQGNIEIYRDVNDNGAIEVPNDVLVSTIPTDCSDLEHEVILLPDDYLVQVVAIGGNPLCTSTAVGFESCVQSPTPVAFSVTVGEPEPVDLAFTFSYENDEDHNVVFGVGSVVVSIGEVTDQERCGTGATAPICNEDEVCANVDGNGYACHLNCSTLDPDGTGGAAPAADECDADEVCISVGRNSVDLLATNPAALPVPLTINTEGHLADTLWLCNATPAGTGGAGTGGTSTGGAG